MSNVTEVAPRGPTVLQASRPCCRPRGNRAAWESSCLQPGGHRAPFGKAKQVLAMPEMRRSSALIALSELEVGACSAVVTLNFLVLGQRLQPPARWKCGMQTDRKVPGHRCEPHTSALCKHLKILPDLWRALTCRPGGRGAKPTVLTHQRVWGNQWGDDCIRGNRLLS